MLSQDAYPTRMQNSAAILARHDPVVYEREIATKRSAGLSTAQRASYQQNGFLLMPELFNQEEVGFLFDAMQGMREEFTHAGRKEVIAELSKGAGSGEVRSIFNVHRLNEIFANLVRDPRVLNVAREILGSEVYIHQSRINYKPGFTGKEFY